MFKQNYILYILLFFILLFNSYLDSYYYKVEDNLFFVKNIVFSSLLVISIYFIIKQLINKHSEKFSKVKFLFDNTNDAVYVVSIDDGKVLDINKRACIMLGYDRNELLSKKVSDFRKPLYSNDTVTWEEQIKKLKEEKFLIRRGLHKKKSGEEFPVEANISYIKNKGEEYLIAVARDISSQLQMEERISYKANLLQKSQELISKSVLYTTSDLEGKITSSSIAFEKLSGYTQEELLGKSHNIFRTPDTSNKLYEKMWSTLNDNNQYVGELKNYTKDKSIYWVKVTIDPIFDLNGNKVGYGAYREDITNKKELEYLSSHDMLTNIYNRAEFKKQLEEKIVNAKEFKKTFGLIMIDIDYFKSVNDTYGHQVGDDVLRTVSTSIKSHIRKNDILARWGGEEFVIITNESEIHDLKILVLKLQNIIMKTSFDPVPYVTASFGITIFKENDTEFTIQKRVDDALYEAKNRGRNRYEVIL